MYEVRSISHLKIGIVTRDQDAWCSSRLKEAFVRQKAAATLGRKIAGVDIMESEQGLLVYEANSQPDWKGLSTTNLWTAEIIAAFVIQEAKR
jgi:glutathione synthase/RimK-type ligase-like ATP-grasp enzyme